MIAAIIIGGWILGILAALALVKVGNQRTQFDRVNRHQATGNAVEHMFPSRYGG